MSRALVTGCSTGIGRATAFELTKRGFEVVATARRPKTIEDLDVAATLALDVDSDESVAAAVAAAGRIDVLVNNAGFGVIGPVEMVPLAEVRRKVADNLWVAASDINLAAAEVELAGVVGREVILRDMLLQEEGAFDFVFMDCGPSLGVLTLNALAAANEVFIPLQPHFLALHGMGKLFHFPHIAIYAGITLASLPGVAGVMDMVASLIQGWRNRKTIVRRCPVVNFFPLETAAWRLLLQQPPPSRIARASGPGRGPPVDTSSLSSKKKAAQAPRAATTASGTRA